MKNWDEGLLRVSWLLGTVFIPQIWLLSQEIACFCSYQLELGFCHLQPKESTLIHHWINRGNSGISDNEMKYEFELEIGSLIRGLR